MGKNLMYKTAGKELADRIISVFEDGALDWYYSSVKALGDKSPHEYCKDRRISEVEDILGRIEHGVFS